MPKLNENWFTEIASEGGSALSLQIKERLHSEKSRYQQIDVYATTHFGNLLIIDGYIMLSARDNFLYHEMLTHPALFIHPAPRAVAIIGGGDCGSLREVLKHQDIEQVFQIEIDERVTRVCERFFPELCASNHDARAEFLFDDGIKWMGQRDAQSLDVVIVDSTDPIGPAEGLFNQAFYASCREALRPDGVLIQQSESPLLHRELIRSMHQHMQAAGFNTTRTLFFPQPVYPSGWWSATLASAGDLDTFREKDVSTRAFDTEYYNADVHQAAFALPAFLHDLRVARRS